MTIQPSIYRTDIAALLRKYGRPAGECVEWTGYKNQFGYGRACVTLADGKPVLRTAHRLSYELHTGSIFERDRANVLMHTCDNRACINPAHLQLGTYKDNNRDMAAKGRAHWQKLARARQQPAAPPPAPPARVGDRLELPGHVWRRE